MVRPAVPDLPIPIGLHIEISEHAVATQLELNWSPCLLRCRAFQAEHVLLVAVWRTAVLH
jgi:hypothetical protein